MNLMRFDPFPYFALMMAFLIVMNVVFGVPLRSDQHAALMALYDGLGNFVLFCLSSFCE